VTKILLAVAALVCTLSSVAPAAAEEAVPGNAVLAKPAGDALVIWDASPVVASIVKDKLAYADANLLLEHDAVRVLAGMVHDLDKHVKTVTVRVIYSKTGAVSPVYGTPTFAGIERYANLKVPGPNALSNRDQWQTLGDKAPIPAWVEYTVTGLLPPR
jgi:hypothetical protein